MLIMFAIISLVGLRVEFVTGITYPEMRSDLQQYQDSSRCYPDVGEWYQIYRNYYYDEDFGGAAKCVKYEIDGAYVNFSSPALITFAPNGSNTGILALSPSECYVARDKFTFYRDDLPQGVQPQMYYLIYTDCSTCSVLRHRYAANGYGCTYWRRASSLTKENDCCQFIYDENCGTSPKYQIYYPSCTT